MKSAFYIWFVTFDLRKFIWQWNAWLLQYYIRVMLSNTEKHDNRHSLRLIARSDRSIINRPSCWNGGLMLAYGENFTSSNFLFRCSVLAKTIVVLNFLANVLHSKSPSTSWYATLSSHLSFGGYARKFSKSLVSATFSTIWTASISALACYYACMCSMLWTTVARWQCSWAILI